MLEEVISNWEKYSSTVAALQAWLEDAEQMLNQSENAKRVSTITDTICAAKLYEECLVSFETLIGWRVCIYCIAMLFVFLSSFRISSETSLTGCNSTWI